MKQVKELNKKMTLVIGDWSLVIRHWMGCLLMLSIISSCSVSKQISKQANTILLNDTAISTGHIGISIYEPATNKYWYNYNADKYFIPASNTKLFTLYAGMKYLGDSLVGLRYQDKGENAFNIFPTGDPTFLHTDFKRQPVLDFLANDKKKRFCYTYPPNINVSNEIGALGNGWAWNDYNYNYMVERNEFPIYGNIIKFNYDSLKYSKYKLEINWRIMPVYFSKYIDTIRNISILERNFDSVTLSKKLLKFYAKRDLGSNVITLVNDGNNFSRQEIPFYTERNRTALNILKSDFKINIEFCRIINGDFKIFKIHSQPSDSLFKPMMHRSDNFFAEQTLLMASNELLGYMSDEKIIETLLKTDLKDIPKKPKWVDGSGLSRYNLFTPQSFVYILNKTKNEFGWDRIKNILPTGGTGTLSAYYKKDSSFIYAKTGTLSNNCALSGYLITKKGKLLIFSILVNNYITGATPVRKAVEHFLLAIRENY